MPYYNTTKESGEALRDCKGKAESQDEMIFKFFQRSGRGYSPSQVLHLCLPRAPITSVRRSITNLTSRGFLTKTDNKVKGVYGKPEYVWVINRAQQPSQGELF